MNRAHIVVVGGALVDVRATTRARWKPGQSLPGRARLLAGGAGRNVAVDLARLGHRVTLLTAVGDDALGEWVLAVTAEAGVDVRHAARRQGHTGLFVAVGPEGGEPWCVADARPVEVLSPADLDPWRETIAEASVVVSDANLLEPTHQALAAIALDVARVLLAVSVDKAPRLRGVLQGASLVACNRAEALALTGLPPTLSWQALGTALLTEGVERVVLTHERGGVGIVTGEEAVSSPALDVPVVDASGAGDAVAAIAVHALLAGMSPDGTAALAAAAAALVVQSEDNTPTGLGAVLRS
ncbi:MAG: PfkB family carbohydrate kinase [Armatimonadota bacterium]